MSETSKNKVSILKINPEIYKLRVIYSCAYLFLDKAYIFLDGDPEKEILVRIKPKNSVNPQEIADEFLNELLNASLRYQIAKENRKIREFIVGSALISVSRQRGPEPCFCNQEIDGKRHKALNLGRPGPGPEQEDDLEIEDPMGISVIWEEKYGKDAQKIEDPMGISVPWEEKYGKDA